MREVHRQGGVAMIGTAHIASGLFSQIGPTPKVNCWFRNCAETTVRLETVLRRPCTRATRQLGYLACELGSLDREGESGVNLVPACWS